MDEPAVYRRTNAHKDKRALALADSLIRLTCERRLHANRSQKGSSSASRINAQHPPWGKSFWTSSFQIKASLCEKLHIFASTDFVGFFSFQT